MVRDSRQVLALHKAMLYDKLQKSKPDVNKRVNEANKTIKSGNSVKPVTSDQVKKQQQQLKQSGKVRDAAKLFESFL
jgi:RNA polymerase-interacting CarD/CdnL/TRCF family regulator